MNWILKNRESKRKNKILEVKHRRENILSSVCMEENVIWCLEAYECDI